MGVPQRMEEGKDDDKEGRVGTGARTNGRTRTSSAHGSHLTLACSNATVTLAFPYTLLPMQRYIQKDFYVEPASTGRRRGAFTRPDLNITPPPSPRPLVITSGSSGSYGWSARICGGLALSE